MRGGATEVNETQKWASSKKWLRTTDLEDRKWKCEIMLNELFQDSDLTTSPLFSIFLVLYVNFI
jgi:hypothetical protein